LEKRTNFGALRPVGEKLYVKDDDNIVTRRYAVMHKKWDVMDLLLDQGYLKGRYAEKQRRLANPKAALDVDPAAWEVQNFEVNKKQRYTLENRTAGETLNNREMLHVHQELGSGPSGRGLCLTSVSITPTEVENGTWKNKLKKMYANPGPPFEGNDTVLVLVDLARVPKDKKLLYNLYRSDAQEKAQSVGIKRGRTILDDTQHMRDSVTKNRELFLRVLTEDFIVNIDEVKQGVDRLKKAQPSQTAQSSQNKPSRNKNQSSQSNSSQTAQPSQSAPSDP
jgi:hypothetical protein